MTPKKVADISEPIEQLYSDLTDELLINIARHLSKSTATWSALHEIETLEEMGQLTQENIEIINTYVAKMPEEIKKAMNESRLEALEEIEKKLQQAADNGYLTKPVTDSTVDVVQALSSQAAEQLNLVNQTMLNTSLQQYQDGIYEFRQEMQNAAPRTIESVDDLTFAQNEINIAAGKAVTGTETRYNAMRKAISNLNKKGIVGYYDRANRAWTAEAYVNMDIRTTVHNTYIQSVQTRQQDYGSDVFQVSAHAGARPLCYPYQGKLYSWGGSGGSIRLGDGKTYKYEPIGATSYGEAAGLFGINCGHVPYPMIAGVSEPVKEDIPSKEENDKEYQESQQQRALERQIRYAKRNVEMLGDLATDKDREKIAQAQAQMRAFIKTTGRTRRYDREQIVTQRGTTGIKPTTKTPIAPTPVTPKQPVTPVNNKTIDKIDLGTALTKSLGSDADAYTKVLEKAPDSIKAFYTKLSSKLSGCRKVKNGGVFKPSVNIIEWDYSAYGSKWATLAHEYGHFVDSNSDNTLYTNNEAKAMNSAIMGAFSSVNPVKLKASSSDKFLAALRADKALNEKYKKDKDARKEIHDELLDHRNETSGIQDCFDGWFGTQKSTDSSFRLPWGHGDRYYNRFYNNWVKKSAYFTPNTEEIKQALTSAGVDVSNQTKLKQACRDYDTASELWANITSAMTCEEEVIKYYEKYTPNSLQAFKELAGDMLNAFD